MHTEMQKDAAPSTRALNYRRRRLGSDIRPPPGEASWIKIEQSALLEILRWRVREGGYMKGAILALHAAVGPTTEPRRNELQMGIDVGTRRAVL